MAEHKSGPVEIGANMDYAEHDKTYNLFVNGTKYSVIVLAALLIAMAAGFYTAAGFFSSFILFVILVAVGVVALR